MPAAAAAARPRLNRGASGWRHGRSRKQGGGGAPPQAKLSQTLQFGARHHKKKMFHAQSKRGSLGRTQTFSPMNSLVATLEE